MPHHGSPDPALAAILPVITGPTGQFRHRQHVNLAYYAVRRYGMPDAISTVCAWIRQIAAYERAPQKYHHTVSRAWVEAVAYHVAADPGCADFEDFAARNPGLLDKRLLTRHYRSSTLAAPAARHGWVEPDLLPFPWSAQHGAAASGLAGRQVPAFGPAAPPDLGDADRDGEEHGAPRPCHP